MTILGDRLARGDIILMDGGVSTEIQKQGVDMDSTVWSGIAHVTHPDITREVHESYLRAGAEVITANTFATARHVLEGKDMGDDFEMINRKAVEVAQQARDNAASGDVLVAASISSTPTFDGDRYTERGAAALQNYKDQAAIYAEAGVDLIVLEMMLDLDGAIPCTTAAVESGLPVWVGFSASLRDGAVIGYHEGTRKRPTIDFGELIDTIMAIGGEATGVMHSFMETTGPALDVLADRWPGPKMAYAETGAFRNPDWVFEQVVSVEEYAHAVDGWVRDQGVQIIGGCCGTGPDHIRALHERFCQD